MRAVGVVLIFCQSVFSKRPILMNRLSQNLKFGTPHGCVLGKYKAFGETIIGLVCHVRGHGLTSS